MKRITAVAFFTLASILSAGSALAQNHEVRADVPFNFTVGNKVLPAGTYSISPAMDGAIEIQNRETHLAVLTQTAMDSNHSQSGGELVFQRYGGQYFLREILCEFASMNVNIPFTTKERSARAEEARLHHEGSRVLVAAK